MNRLRIRSAKKPALVVTRHALKAMRVVYVACSNRPVRYPKGRSRIVYVGETRRGAVRVAQSAAEKAADLLPGHGNFELSFFLVESGGRQRVKSWEKLEMALIVAFRKRFGAPPKYNSKGKNREWGDLLNYYRKDRLDGVIAQYS